MAFINGKADPWGMKVNPALQEIELPDGPSGRCWTPTSPRPRTPAARQNPAVYFTQIAAPVTTLRKIAEALLDAWPNVQTRCDFDPVDPLLQARPGRPADVRRPLHARPRQPR